MDCVDICREEFAHNSTANIIETEEDCSQIIQKGIEALVLHEYVDAV